MTEICAHPDCELEGTFPAPRDPSNISARQYFCEKHIKEFNKNWNGLKGFSSDDLYTLQSGATWGRPTWKMGVNTESYKKATLAADKNYKNPYTLFGDMDEDQATTTFTPKMPKKITEACETLGIEPPLTPHIIKKRFTVLAKKFHPDIYTGDDAAERMGIINDAYTTLKDYLKRQEAEAKG
ncbi:MAG: DnaJ domain-containing protein [Alphaproteobacteria bacterium]|nr:DnaJ domain-containing protein [Alphaproteobacteria bacterium]